MKKLFMFALMIGMVLLMINQIQPVKALTWNAGDYYSNFSTATQTIVPAGVWSNDTHIFVSSEGTLKRIFVYLNNGTYTGSQYTTGNYPTSLTGSVSLNQLYASSGGSTIMQRTWANNGTSISYSNILSEAQYGITMDNSSNFYGWSRDVAPPRMMNYTANFTYQNNWSVQYYYGSNLEIDPSDNRIVWILYANKVMKQWLINGTPIVNYTVIGDRDIGVDNTYIYTVHSATDRVYIYYKNSGASGIPPQLVLNAPSNNSVVPNQHNINFNFTTTGCTTNCNCSIYLDNNLNQTNSSTLNGVLTNFLITGIPYSNHNWTINCKDESSGLSNSSTYYFSNSPNSILHFNYNLSDFFNEYPTQICYGLTPTEFCFNSTSFTSIWASLATKITWADAMNGTLFKTSQWNATNTSYITNNSYANLSRLNVITNITSVNGNFTGNLTFNGYYAGCYFYNGTGIPIELNTTLQKVTAFDTSLYRNGFSFNATTGTLQLLDDGGMYRVSWDMAGDGVNNHIYTGFIFVNDVQQNNTFARTEGMQSNTVRLNGMGFLRLNRFDNVSLYINDQTGTTSGTAYYGNINLYRVGN